MSTAVSAFDLNQDFARIDPVALGHVNGSHLAGNRGLHFGFHLHRFGNQHRLTGLDHVAQLDQYVDDIARGLCASGGCICPNNSQVPRTVSWSSGRRKDSEHVQMRDL